MKGSAFFDVAKLLYFVIFCGKPYENDDTSWKSMEFYDEVVLSLSENLSKLKEKWKTGKG